MPYLWGNRAFLAYRQTQHGRYCRIRANPGPLHSPDSLRQNETCVALEIVRIQMASQVPIRRPQNLDYVVVDYWLQGSDLHSQVLD